MAQVWKDILYPRSVYVNGKWYRFDSSDLENAVRVNREKLADGWNIPVCYEHQDDAVPVKLSRNSMLADKAKSTCGWVEDFRLNENRMEALVEVPHEADAQKLNAIRYVSPQVEWNFKDSEGKTWPGLTIQHVAATARPVQQRQDAIRLSIPASKHCSEATGPLRLGAMDMDFAKILAALAAKGIILPEDTTPENGWDRLYIAVLQGDPTIPMAEPVDEPEPVGTDANLKPDERPIAMSLSLEKQQKQAEALARKNIIRDIANLKDLGVNPGLTKSLTKKAESISLSFDAATGDLVPNEVTMKIDAYREVAAAGISPDAKGGKAALSLVEAERPAHMRTGPTAREEDMSDEDKAEMERKLDERFGKRPK